jgi:REP element-mobilizing transposase RayT
MRRAKGLPSFRTDLVHRRIVRAIADTGRVRGEAFRLVHYSIQADHIHLVVEADEHDDLSNGMRSFAIRVALRINRLLRRDRGRVWADRHHRRDLTTPSEVRNALVYLLSNHLKHGETDVGLVDPYSSAPWFEGWVHGFDPPPEPSATTRATTWLLREGWETRGLIHRGEAPKSPPPT